MQRHINEKIAFEVLAYLEENASAAGAGALHLYLRKRGCDISPATAGRLLKDLDDKGLTEKRGNQGRALSECGRELLRRQRKEKQRQEWIDAFRNALDSDEQKRILELMSTRLPIAMEMARMAAVNATEQETEQLRLLVEEQERLAAEHRSLKEIEAVDMRFHKLLAAISRNHVSDAVVELIRANEEEVRLAGGKADRVAPAHGYEHRQIYEAIRLHDAEMAALVMKRHIESSMNCEKRHS